MARPQLEDGRTEIANEIVEALAKTYLNVGESRVLWAILRKTYGWHKKFDRISFTQFEGLTGMGRQHIFNSLNSLIQRKIITRRGNDYKLEYGLQKDYELWDSLPIDRTNRVKHLKSLPIDRTITKTENQSQSLPIDRTIGSIVTHTENTPLPIDRTKSLPIDRNTKAIKATIQKQYKKTTAANFEEYQKELRLRFSDLEFDLELEKFNLYWNNGNRKLKNPKLALLNWLTKAREIKAKGAGDGKDRQVTGGAGVHTTEQYRKSLGAPLH